MDNLDAVADAAIRDLDRVHAAREEALKRSREVIRASSQAIRALHRGHDAQAHLDAARSAAAALTEAARPLAEVWAAGYTRDALAELVEAECFAAYRAGRPLPDLDALSVPAAAYVLGLGDLIGELRRSAVDRLKQDDPAGADDLLEAMEALSDTLFRFDYPDGLVPLRSKQDAARGILEKTRGEVALARSNKRTQEKLESVRGLLDRLEKGDPPKKAPKKDKDLDIDSVW